MGLLTKVRLIPRYNWDYGFLDAVSALSSLLRRENGKTSILEESFGQRAVYTTSGRTSLYTILKALHLPSGAGVGVPLFCCSVVSDAIAQAGLVPVFLDITSDDYNISPEDLEKKRKRIAAIVVVHMFGHPADLEGISRVCGDGIPVIEDCAQSLFSEYKGHAVGFQMTASFFSFRSGKYLSAGEGSAIFCRDVDLFNAVTAIAATYPSWSLSGEIAHCASTLVKSTLYHRPWYGTIGYPVGTLLDRKWNLTAKEGFSLKQISRVDLKIVDDRVAGFRESVQRQRKNSELLRSLIEPGSSILPLEKEGCRSNFYQFAIRFTAQSHRDEVATYLWEHGIDSARYLDDIAEYARRTYGYEGDCPVAERCAKTVLSIPNHYTITSGTIERIARVVSAGIQSAGL